MRTFFARALLSSVLALLVHHAYAGDETDLERSNRILKEVTQRVENQYRAPAANLDHLPQPIRSASPADMARQFARSPITKQLPATPELMVFVSFSMPHESLVHIVEQSEKTGAKLIFRGFAGDKLSDMSKRVADLIGRHRVEALVHPPAFTQFKVVQVPTLVISLSDAGNQLDNGCAQPDRYIKVTGDVGQDYALDLIERTQPKWATLAAMFNGKLQRSSF
jgi:conjugal transfer pilus assembly protein TrbC